MGNPEKPRHQKFTEGVTAFAALGDSIAAFAAFLAWLFAPTGITAVLIGLGLLSVPLIVSIQPVIGIVVATIAAVAGLARFYTWWKSR